MIQSIEGKRGLPRQRPPLIAEAGLFGRPTLNHNVETLYWVPAILRQGAEWFRAEGKPGHPGPRLYSVSGRVARPGVIQAPAGSTAAELIARAGGMAPGHRLAAFLPGGASGGILPGTAADRPLDFGTLDDLGAFVGSHALIVLSHRDDVRRTALNLMRFFERESCGQCTPCRSGTAMLATLLADGTLDQPLIADLDQVMRDASICGLGQAAPNPVRSLLRFFAEPAP
jgi:formate dehydrogenase